MSKAFEQAERAATEGMSAEFLAALAAGDFDLCDRLALDQVSEESCSCSCHAWDGVPHRKACARCGHSGQVES